jgi:tRNA(fMet)-specific endonuclease VapC
VHQSTKYLDRCDALLKEYEERLLADDVVTAHFYGAIRAELRSKGIVIQHSDVWIAALARQYALTIATTDQHFGNISALRYEIWP